MRFKIIIDRESQLPLIVIGKDIDPSTLTIGHATGRVEEAERYLSRLLGLTVKIESEV